jgi:DNA polymerase (family 10)
VLSERELQGGGDGKTIAARSERDLHHALGMPFIAPELREDRGEIEAALAGRLPALVRERDLKGSLHNHTTFSDGAHSLEEMTQAARARGFEYLGITDHSQAAFYAHGLDAARVREQQAQIDRLAPAMAPLTLLKGIEVDILQDGSLDLDPDTLASFDFAVGSVHGQLELPDDRMTARLVRAVRSGKIDILGHPTGRLLLSRSGSRFDWAAVLEAAAEREVAIEINGSPQRRDIDWRLCQQVTKAGVRVAINADAHAIDELDYLTFGIAVARKGWIEAKDVLNALPVQELRERFRRRRNQA